MGDVSWHEVKGKISQTQKGSHGKEDIIGFRYGCKKDKKKNGGGRYVGRRHNDEFEGGEEGNLPLTFKCAAGKGKI